MVSFTDAYKADHACARVGTTRTVPATPVAITVGAGDINTWLPITDSSFTGGGLANGMENLFTVTTSTGIILSTFTDTRKIMFVGDAQMSISVPSAIVEMGLFLNTDTDPIENLLSPLEFVAQDHILSLGGNKILNTTGGDYYTMQARCDTACTITVYQLSVSFWG